MKEQHSFSVTNSPTISYKGTAIKERAGNDVPC